MGFAGYFLITADFVKYAKDNNFDMIDSIIVKSKEERDKINKITYIGFESYPNV